MSRTSLKNIKRFFILSIICGVGALAVTNFDKFMPAKAVDEPIFDFEDVSGFVDNEYKSYIEEKTAYHNETYPGSSLYPESLSEKIDGSNYYLNGTTVQYSEGDRQGR